MYEKHDFMSSCEIMGKSHEIQDCFYGSVTVGERGQIVIPADARNDLEIKPGDKLLIIRHPVHNGLMVCRLEDTIGFFEEMNQKLQQLKAHVQETEE